MQISRDTQVNQQRKPTLGQCPLAARFNYPFEAGGKPDKIDDQRLIPGPRSFIRVRMDGTYDPEEAN